MTSEANLRRACTHLTRWLNEPPAEDPDLKDEVWQAILVAARAHGIGPRLVSMLPKTLSLPAEVRDWVEVEARLNAERIDRLCREGLRILETARDRGLEVLPLKGLALAAYPVQLEIRPMADIDLLVRPDDGDVLHCLMRDLGYGHVVSKAKHDEYLGPSGRRVVSRIHEHPDNPRPVDVHRRCGESFARSRVDLTEKVWASSRTAFIRGAEVTVPGVEELWTHLLVHCAWQWFFGGGRMVQLLDLADLLPEVSDPAALCSTVDARVALLALKPAASLKPECIPPALIEDLETRAGRSASRLAASLEALGSSHLAPDGRSLLLRILRLHRDRPRDLIRAAGYVLAPRIGEMLINHDRVPRGPARILAYPVLWLWHTVNLIALA